MIPNTIKSEDVAWELLKDGNLYAEMPNGGLIITLQGQCIINYIQKNGTYKQYVWDKELTDDYITPNKKEILVRKYKEIEELESTFNL